MHNKRIVRKVEISVYILFAVFYFWMAAQIPYTLDDWTWGLDVGLHQLISANVNSRYVGNFFVVIMTRSEMLKTIIMGVFYFLCPFLVSSLIVRICHRDSAKFRLLYFFAANVIFLSIPRLVWREACGWVSGFANFGISASFMLTCFHAWLPVFDDTIEKNENVLKCIVFCFVVFAGQLFIENLSLAMAIASVLIACVSYMRDRKSCMIHVLMALGAILGLVVMFSSTIYETLVDTGEAVGGYRKFLFHSGKDIRESMIAFLYQCAVLAIRCGEANTVLSSVILILLGIYTASQKKEKTSTKLWICAINAVLIVYILATRIADVQYSSENIYRAMIAAVVNAGYLVIVIWETFRIMKTNKPFAIRLLAVLGFALSLIAPLTVIDENGSRLFYTFIVVVSIYVLLLADELVSMISDKFIDAGLGMCGLIGITLIVLHVVVYSAIGDCKTARSLLIEEANSSNAETVILPGFPYGEYLHFPDPLSDRGEQIFKEFFDIKPSIDVVIEAKNS